MTVRELKEAQEFSPGRVDREGKVIYDVAVLSENSKNKGSKGRKRRYSQNARTEALGYFDGAPVFLGHKKEKEADNLVGELRNLSLAADGKVRGDLHITEKHSYILDTADRFPKQIGMSIMATGKIKETFSEEIIEGFAEGRRRSVDIVTDPATVKNLFESKENDVELEELKKEVEALKKENENLKPLKEENEKLKAEIEKSQQSPPPQDPPQGDQEKTLQEQVVSLENKLLEQNKKYEALAEEKKEADKKAKVEKMIQESGVASSDVFVSCLLKCDKEEDMKALIEDRKKAGGVQKLKSQGVIESFQDQGKEQKDELKGRVLKVIGR